MHSAAVTTADHFGYNFFNRNWIELKFVGLEF